MQHHSRRENRHLRAIRRNRPGSAPPRRLWRTALLAALVAGVTAAAAYLAWRTRPAFVPQTVPVTHGSVEVSVEADVFVVRHERLYPAPAAGGVRRLVAEGQRVRVGAPVAEVNGAPVLSETAGLVSYQVDGLEQSLSPGAADKWQPAWFKALPVPNLSPLPDSRAEAGLPLFKVMDTFNQALLTMVSLEAIPPVDQGATVKIRFSGWGGATANATIARISREGSEGVLYLTAPVFPEALGGVRKARVTLVFDSFTGNVVPRTAIDVRGGRQGVWALEGAKPVFVPGKVLGGNAVNVVLEADLAPGSLVVRVAPSHMD